MVTDVGWQKASVGGCDGCPGKRCPGAGQGQRFLQGAEHRGSLLCGDVQPRLQGGRVLRVRDRQELRDGRVRSGRMHADRSTAVSPDVVLSAVACAPRVDVRKDPMQPR